MSLIDYKIVSNQKFLHLPHASGAAPTINVITVYTPKTSPSTITNSPINENKKAHPQYSRYTFYILDDTMNTKINEITITLGYFGINYNLRIVIAASATPSQNLTVLNLTNLLALTLS